MAFGTGTYALGFVAGILTTLSPCVLPLLPIVLGSAMAAHPRGAMALGLGVTISFTTVGLFVATIGFAIGLDSEWFRQAGAILLVLLGLVLLSGSVQQRFAAAASPVSRAGDSMISRLRLEGFSGQLVVGLLLGVVWAPCVGPTLGAASTLAAQRDQLPEVAAIMLLFGIGAAVPLVVLGSLSRAAVLRWRSRMLSAGKVGKLALGGIMLALGGIILSGLDKRKEALGVQYSPSWLIDLTTRF
jgi:cytochrome c biogenesis protein CcdA